MRFSVATTLCLFAADKATLADAETLSCNVGASMALDSTVSACTMSDKRYKDNKPFDGPTDTICTGDQFACLSGNWAGDYDTAYGCFGGSSVGGANQIENAKAQIVTGCKSSPSCLAANPDGVPARGWTSCTTTNCNPCEAPQGGAGISAPSMTLGIFALLLSFMSQV